MARILCMAALAGILCPGAAFGVTTISANEARSYNCPVGLGYDEYVESWGTIISIDPSDLNKWFIATSSTDWCPPAASHPNSAEDRKATGQNVSVYALSINHVTSRNIRSRGSGAVGIVGKPPHSTSFPCASPSDEECSTTPVILDTGDGIYLTSADDGVTFDIDADGVLEQTAWITSPCHAGFLVLDRNDDDSINDGRELFGNVTPQPAAEAQNGFLALRVFDQRDNGGNEDGEISPADAIFGKLRLWIDANHDGISQPWEMETLAQRGIASISLRYKRSQKHDIYGNTFRYRAKVYLFDGTHTYAYDVMLVQQ